MLLRRAILRWPLAGLALVVAPVLAGCQFNAASTPRAAALTPIEPPVVRLFRPEPFIGVPGNQADDLIEIMVANSPQRAARVTLNPFAKVDYLLRGSLTAIANDDTGTIVYQFEVVTPEGRPVYRLSGQEVSGGAAGDPWSGVTSIVLERVALRTLDGLSAWVSAAP
jgi:hypothetical protein